MFEAFGEFLGASLGRRIIDGLTEKTAFFQLEVEGKEYLRGIKGGFILASNHPIAPPLLPSLDFGASPYALLLARVIREETGKPLAIVMKYNQETKRFPSVLTKTLESISKGVLRGIRFLPVNTQGAISEFTNFMAATRQCLEAGQPVSIVVSGQEDLPSGFDPHATQPGVAHLAKKFRVPILPCFTSVKQWNKGSPAFVAFGQPINPDDHSKNDLVKFVGESIAGLQAEHLQKQLIHT